MGRAGKGRRPHALKPQLLIRQRKRNLALRLFSLPRALRRLGRPLALACKRAVRTIRAADSPRHATKERLVHAGHTYFEVASARAGYENHRADRAAARAQRRGDGDGSAASCCDQGRRGGREERGAARARGQHV